MHDISASRSIWRKTICALVGTVLLTPLSGCADSIYVGNQLAGRASAQQAGITDVDRDALDRGDLGAILDRYDALDRNRMTIAQLSLLCDVLLKFSEIGKAQACLDELEARTKQSGASADTQESRLIAGNRALLELALGDPKAARNLMAKPTSAGDQYVLALSDIRVADLAKRSPTGTGDKSASILAPYYRTEASSIADRLALQFDPTQVYYAANLYAALGEPQRALDLLLEPQRSLLRLYGLAGSKNEISSSVAPAPFRLDIFDEFSFGWFKNVHFAPAANAYVEYLAAHCLLELNRDEEARGRLDTILSYPNIAAYRDVYWRALYDRARIAARDGDSNKARSLLMLSIDIIEVARGTVATEIGRISFLDDKEEVYGTLIQLLASQGDLKQALEFVERSRCRALVDLLSSRDTLGNSAPAEDLVQKLDREEVNLTVTSTTTSGSDVERVVSRVKSVGDEIRSRFPDLAPLVTVSPVDVAALQRLIAPNEAVLEFARNDRGLWVFVLTATSITEHKIEAKDLEETIEDFYQALSDDRQSDSQRLGKLLYAELLDTSLRGLTAKKLTIVPSGPLYHVAFAALNDGTNYLVERYSIRIVPSLTVLTLPTRRFSGKGGIVVGNPSEDDPNQVSLPGAADEARWIVESASDSKLLLGSEATIAAFRANAAGHIFFHFAGHGLFDQEHPLQSGLVFAPPGGDGGSDVLTATDLYSMNLAIDVAVVSGCSTGRADITTGDDVLGLVRGFLYAGPSTVVASLWSVHDEATKELMKAFYAEYLRGIDPADALRDAEIRLISTGRYSANEWAPFFVTSIAN